MGEDLLDAGLAAAHEVEGGVEFVLVDLAQAEHGGERVSGKSCSRPESVETRV